MNPSVLAQLPAALAILAVVGSGSVLCVVTGFVVPRSSCSDSFCERDSRGRCGPDSRTSSGRIMVKGKTRTPFTAIPSVTRPTADAAAFEPQEPINIQSQQSGLDANLEAEKDDNKFVWTQQWYPILPASYAKGLDLETKPLAFDMLDQKLVLWKSSDNQYSVLQDTCPHRRAPLSTGKVVPPDADSESSESSLACRYHGWEYDAQGSCTKIPMQIPPSSESSSGPTSRIRVLSYPVRESGGMLWVFMDPFYLSASSTKSLPEIPVNAAVPQEELESSTLVWIFSAWPISYLSMLENSLDPSHAPFVHEGTQAPGTGMAYSPENAQPMQVYQITNTSLIPEEGFTLEHSPYMKSKLDSPANVSSMSTRQFIPPCTTVVSSPGAFAARLYFVPNSPTTTTTIGYFKLPSSPLLKRLDRVQRLLLPSSVRQMVGNWLHVFLLLSDFRVRFGKQDMWTMQGQDERKVADWTARQQEYGDSRTGRRSSWDDLVVTPSDAGVAALQRWMQKFGNGGPFPLHALTGNRSTQSSPGTYVRPMSIWDSHGKFSPQCHAVRRQAANWEQRFGRLSTISLATSAMGAVYGLVSNAVPLLLGRRAIANRSILYAAALISLVFSVTFGSLSNKCRRLQEAFFSTGDSDGSNHILEQTYRY